MILNLHFYLITLSCYVKEVGIHELSLEFFFFSFLFDLLTCSVEGVVILELERLFILATLASESLGAPAYPHHSSCQLSRAGNIENEL